MTKASARPWFLRPFDPELHKSYRAGQAAARKANARELAELRRLLVDDKPCTPPPPTPKI